MNEYSDTGHEKITFTFVAGTLYILFGILQAIAATGLAEIPLVPGNAIGVFVLFVIGIVFLFGYKELKEGIPDGIAYLFVGILLSLIFGILYLLVMGADVLSAYILKSEDFENWTLLDDVRPELYLAFLSLISYLRWKNEFS